MLQAGDEQVSEPSIVEPVLMGILLADSLSPQSFKEGKYKFFCRKCKQQAPFCDRCPKRQSLVVFADSPVLSEDRLPSGISSVKAHEGEQVSSAHESAIEWIGSLETLWKEELALSDETWIDEWITDPRKIWQKDRAVWAAPFSEEASEKGISSRETEFLKATLKYAKRGDRAAFEVLYWLYTKLIWNRLIGLVGKKEIAEDLHQETFLRAWTHLPSLDDAIPFERWLYKVAAHIAIDYLRHEKMLDFVALPEEESVQQFSESRFSLKGPEESVCDAAHLELALSQVSSQFRLCLLLQDHWGFSQREIAALLNITVGCVGSYIYRGREQFRQAYWRLQKEEEGI